MNTLYYGNGECSITGEAYGVEIRYRGAIEIDPTHASGYSLFEGNNKIIIVPLGSVGQPLSNLFSYEGEFKIINTIACDRDGNRIGSYLKPIMDYSELIGTKSEDMTMLSEEMGVGYVKKKRVSRTMNKQAIIENLHTKNSTLYLKDGKIYKGSFHIHKKNGMAMTGAVHSDNSQELFIKQINIATGKPIDKLISTKNTATAMNKKRNRKNTTRRRTRSTGGY